MINILSKFKYLFIKLIGLFIIKLEKIKYMYIYSVYRDKYKIHNTFKFNGNGIIFYGDGDIVIGENSYIGRNTYLQAAKQKKNCIGKEVSISHFVYIYTTSSIADQDFINKSKNCFKQKNQDVIINDYCWIGAKVFINPGITIGENTVIGANSVITKNLPPHCIAVGIPAKVIKFKNYLDLVTKEKLMRDYYTVLSDDLKYNLKL